MLIFICVLSGKKQKKKKKKKKKEKRRKRYNKIMEIDRNVTARVWCAAFANWAQSLQMAVLEAGRDQIIIIIKRERREGGRETKEKKTRK